MKKLVMVVILLRLALLGAEFPRPWEPILYTNSTIAYCEVSIDGIPAVQGDEVGAFVGEECRGVGYVVTAGGQAVCTMNIQGNVMELANFAVWDASEDLVCQVSYSTNTLPGGDIGYPPDLLPINALSDPNQNLAPVWNLPDTLSWAEDTTYYLDLNVYAWDPEGAALSYDCLNAGDLQVIIQGSIAELIPEPDYYGVSNLVFSASDGENNGQDSVFAVVMPVNDPPQVNMYEDFVFEEDSELYIDLSLYVFDVDDDVLDITITGNINVFWQIEDMILQLSAAQNWFGSENLTLTASDGQEEDSDNFMVTITPINDPPVLNLPEEVSFYEDGELLINLDNYTIDPDGDALTWQAESGEFISAQITGSFLLLSAPDNWYGSEELLITVYDPEQLSDMDTLLVIVIAVNDAPVIELPESFSFDEDTSLSLDFNDYVYDVDDDELSLLVSGNSQISVQINGLLVVLSAGLNWWGEEDLLFTVNDGMGRATASDIVTVYVLPVNDPPEINLPSEISFYTYNELSVDFSEYIFDPDSDELLLSVSQAVHVGVEIDGLEVIFSAEPGWIGIELISFTISDGEYEADDEVIVEVLELGDLPDIILPQTISFLEDSQLTRDFGNYIFNTEGFNLELNATGNQEMVVDIADFLVTFSAPQDWWGMEELCFTITDAEAGFSASDSVIINVQPVNDPPEINLPAMISFPEDTTYTLDCEEYIYDIDSGELTLSVSGNQMILVSIDGLVLEFAPPANYNGSELMTVFVNDNSGRAISSDSLLVIVEPVNDPPVLNLPAEIMFLEDEIYELPVYLYVFDVDGDSLSITFASDFGCQFNWQDDIVILVPPLNFYGSGTIIISVTDGWELVEGEIAVVILPVNDPPTLSLPESFVFPEDTIFSFDMMDYAEDVDGDNLSVTYSGTFFIFAEISGTTVSLQPLNNWNGSAVVTFTVDDGFATASDEVLIVVEPVNDPPHLNSFVPAQTQLLYYGENEVEFSVNVYDNDSEIQYAWYVNGTDQFEENNHFIYNFTEGGVYTVLVEFSDEEFTLEHQWQVTIYTGPGWQLVVYTNSTIAYSVVTLDDEPAGGNDLVGAFVGDECRGIGEIAIAGGVSFSSFLIQGESIETVHFKLYSAEDEAIYDILYTTQTNPGGDLGNPPYDLLPLAAYREPGPGWIATDIYDNYTSVYTVITIDGVPADELDILGAFDNVGMCLGIGMIEVLAGNAFSNIEVFQDEVVEFSFRLWDASENSVYNDYQIYETFPGGQIGEPGAELEINLVSTPGPNWEPVVYTNSTTGYFTIRVNGNPAAEQDILGVFVADECRGTGNIVSYENESISTVEIQGESVENCYFRLWDASLQQILNSDLIVETLPGGDIGYPPDEIELDFWSYELPEFQVFPRPWNVVYYTNSTVAYGSLSMDNQPVFAGNEIAAFIDEECRGTATTVDNGDQTIFTMNIQGDSPEIVQFNYYDIADNIIYCIEYLTLTNPGGDLGYPPNLLPLTIFTNFPPQVNLPDSFTFDEDEIVSQDMNEFIFDPDGDELVLEISGNENINIIIEGMLVTAWGNENWFGTETVYYSVDDGHDHIITGSLDLIVLPVNDAPIVNLPYSFTMQEDSELTVDFDLFITDVEGDAWTLSVTGAENIAVDINGSLVTFAPDENWFGQEVLVFYADDGMDAGSDSIIMIVNPVPDAPVVDFPEQLFILENSFLILNFNDYICDPDGDDFEVYVSETEYINCSVAGDSISFVPQPDWFGTEIITIYADDGTSRLIGSDDVEIVVEFVHQPPELFLPDQFILQEDIPQTFDLIPYFYIYEGEEYIFTATGNDSIFLEFEGANLSISAPLNWFGTETVIITLDDEPARISVSDTVNIVIEGVNDPPVLIAWEPEILDIEAFIDTTITFSVLVEDVEGDVIYNWYINELLQQVFEPELSIMFDEEGEFQIQCAAFDDVEEVSVNWQVIISDVKESQDEIYETTELEGNFPNPFNPVTVISFTIQADDLPAELSIYNLKGQIIRHWNISHSGRQSLIWDAKNRFGIEQASGIYLYCLSGKKSISHRRMLLLK
jgi:hypothetical protein